MNEENQERTCSACGAKLPENGYCLRCGLYNNVTENNNSTTNNQEDGFVSQFDQKIDVNDLEKQMKQDERKRLKKKFILALINLIIIVPTVSSFFGIWVLFGALSGDSFKYSVISLVCLIYIIFSYIAFLFSIVNLFSKDKLNKCLKILSIVLVIAVLFGPTISKKKAKDRYIKELSKVNMEEKYILENDELKVKQKKISVNSQSARIYYSVEKSGDKPFSCENQNPKFRVNGYNMTRGYAFYSNSKITTDSETGDCILNISINDLDEFNIKEIFAVDLWIGKDIVNFETDSKKTSNDGDFEFLKGNKYLLHENDYFKIYYDPNYRYEIKIYLVSKIKEDYSLVFTNEDLDTPGYMNGDMFVALLYDNTINKNTYSYHPCDNNLKYYKAHYVITTNDGNKIEGDIDEHYDEYKVTDRYCQAKK